MLRGWYSERIAYEHYERKFSHINTCNPAWILIYKWLPESLQLVLCSMRITFSNEYLIDLILKMWIWVSPLLTGNNSIMLFQFCHYGCSHVELSYTPTVSVLLVGYGFILMVALLFTGLHAFQQYSRGECLTITIYFDVLTNWGSAGCLALLECCLAYMGCSIGHAIFCSTSSGES